MNNINASWATAIKSYWDWRCLTLLLLGFCAGLPLLLIFSSLSLWLREAGVDRATVTMFSWAALAYSFKFVWAPLVDNLSLPCLSLRLGRRRAWLLLSQIGIVLAIILMAMQNPIKEHDLVLMALCTVFLGFSAATQDIVIDAYRIECAPVSMQSALSACYIAGYRVGMIVAGAGSLYLASFLGTSASHYDYEAWQYTYYVMAACMSLGIATCFFMSEPQIKKEILLKQGHAALFYLFILLVTVFVLVFWGLGQYFLTSSLWLAFLFEVLRLSLALLSAAAVAVLLVHFSLFDQDLLYQTWLEPLLDFFRRYGKHAFWLLLLIGFYRVSDIVAGVISNLFYQDLGFSKNDIATAVKTVGLLMSILGGFIGGLFAQRYALIKMLFWGALLACITNLLFACLALKGQDMLYFYFAVVSDNLSAGFASAVFVAFLSALTNIRFTAVQYAIFSSLMTLLPKTLGGYSGAMVNGLGYPEFFVLTFLIGLPVLFLVSWLGKQQVLENPSAP